MVKIEVLLVPIIALIIITYITGKVIYYLYKKLIEMIGEKSQLEMDKLRLNSEIVRLRYEVSSIKNTSQNTSSLSNDEIEKVLRYAMKKAHPDNGGNEEDFILFRSMHDRIRMGVN